MALDSQHRTIDYLRISVTDRCNLRCRYCMPAAGVAEKSHEQILRIEEIVRFVKIAATEFGFKNIRLTGGEPLVRKGIVGLVESIRAIAGIENVAITTNGVLLPQMARDLKSAGLNRLNVSLDTLNSEQYSYITRGGNIADVMAGIDKALEVGFDSIKINAVVVRQLKQDLLAYTKLSLDRPLHVRFIEYMPIGDVSLSGNELEDVPEDILVSEELGWTAADTIPIAEMLGLIDSAAAKEGLGKLVPIELSTSIAQDDQADKPDGFGPAKYYRFEGAPQQLGSVGFITAISNHFCASCNRVRLTSDGKIRPCLFSDDEYSVIEALHNGDDQAVAQALQSAIEHKPLEHAGKIGTARQMSQIGG